MRDPLDVLEREGILLPEQAELLRRIYDRRLLSVHWELRLLLYVGVLVAVTGVGLLLHKHLADALHLAVLGGAGGGAAACFAYAVCKGDGWRPGPVASPNLAYDYSVLLGCLLLGTLVGYGEVQYRLLGDLWRFHLLGTGLFFVTCAHYFDNRMVLSLGLTTLAAWLGVEIGLRGVGQWERLYRGNALGFGATVAGVGWLQARLGWKRHFLPVHLHLGVNLALLALVSGVVQRGAAGVGYLVLLLAAAGATCGLAVRHQRFSFLVSGVLAAYAGVTGFLLQRAHLGVLGVAAYFLVTSVAVVVGLWTARRRLEAAA